MTTTIAFAGKGGTGKTTVAALLIRALLERGGAPLLAIDADPAANLHLALGLPMPFSVGEIREDMAEAAQKGQLGVSISRQDYLTREIQMALEEGTQIDLLAMGRPEGQGCYCASTTCCARSSTTWARPMPRWSSTTRPAWNTSAAAPRDVDLLLLVPTRPWAVRTAAGVAQLAATWRSTCAHAAAGEPGRGELPEPLQAAIRELGLEVAATIPADEHVNELDALGSRCSTWTTARWRPRRSDRLAASILERLRVPPGLEPHP
jgi:CO dehydrogenase maturation factor